MLVQRDQKLNWTNILVRFCRSVHALKLRRRLCFIRGRFCRLKYKIREKSISKQDKIRVRICEFWIRIL